MLHENSHDLDAVLLLEAPDDVLMERMLARGRADDTAEAISRRLALYHSETKPLLDYYATILVADRRRRRRRRGAAAGAGRAREAADGDADRASTAEVAYAAWSNGESSSRPAVSCRRCVPRGACWPTAIVAGRAAVAPGVSTLDINDAVAAVIADAGATSNFLHYGARGADRGFPATICASVNDEVVHGIPTGVHDPARGRPAVHRRRLHPGRLAFRLRGVRARR